MALSLTEGQPSTVHPSGKEGSSYGSDAWVGGYKEGSSAQYSEAGGFEMKKTFLVVYAKGDSNYSGCAPDILGCVSVGDTLEEMRANMKEALEFHLEGTAEDNLPMPEPMTDSVKFSDEDFADGVRYFVVEKLEINLPEITHKPARLSA